MTVEQGAAEGASNSTDAPEGAGEQRQLPLQGQPETTDVAAKLAAAEQRAKAAEEQIESFKLSKAKEQKDWLGVHKLQEQRIENLTKELTEAREALEKIGEEFGEFKAGVERKERETDLVSKLAKKLNVGSEIVKKGLGVLQVTGHYSGPPDTVDDKTIGKIADDLAREASALLAKTPGHAPRIPEASTKSHERGTPEWVDDLARRASPANWGRQT